MAEHDPARSNSDLKQIIASLWTTPENAGGAPKTDVIPLGNLREWMKSSDIEILGFAHSMIHDTRWRIEPPLPVEDYVVFVKDYYERCLLKDTDGEWSDGRFSAGCHMVNIFAGLWRDPEVPRSLLGDLKNWIANVYKNADEGIRFSMVQATFDHLVEDKKIRDFFSIGETILFCALLTTKLACGPLAAEARLSGSRLLNRRSPNDQFHKVFVRARLQPCR